MRNDKSSPVESEDSAASSNAADSYVRQAALLRWCLQCNLDDHDHATTGGRFVYLADTNIVFFFTNPEKDKDFVAVFGSGTLNDYAAGTALVTAEYMFSRELPGQGSTPVLIAPAHGEELQDVFAAKERDRSEIPADTPGTESPELNRLVRQVRDREIDLKEAIDQFCKLVPELARHVLRESLLQEATQLLRLYQNELLRPLALHPAATAEILNFRSDPMRQKVYWLDRLKQYRPARQEGRSEEDLQTLAKRDAEVLVQTMLLDRAAVEEGGGTRYVLLTADTGLFDAYVSWYWTERLKVDPAARFVLRLPLQYAPILNVQDMPNGVAKSDVIIKARDALDGLLVNAATLREGYPHKLAYHLIKRPGRPASSASAEAVDDISHSANLDDHSKRSFRNIRRFWRASFSNGIVLNADLMQRRLRAQFAVLARLLRENADFLTALHDAQQQIMVQVLTAHASITTRLNLRTLTRGDPAAGRIQRAPLILRKQFPLIVGDHHRLADVLNKLATFDQSMIESAERALGSVPRHEALFFASCVAHRCRHWQAARLFARWAQLSLPKRPESQHDRTELVYLEASATRYEFASVDLVLGAFAALGDQAEKAIAGSEHLVSARALCERCSILLVTLYRARLLDELEARSVANALATPLFTLGSTLEEAAGSLAKLAERDSMADELKIHINANVISSFVYTRFLQPPSLNISEPSRALVMQALDELAPLLEHEGRPMILILEHTMARHALGQLSIDEAARILDLNCDRERPARLKLDNAEVEFFQTLLHGQRQELG